MQGYLSEHPNLAKALPLVLIVVTGALVLNLTGIPGWHNLKTDLTALNKLFIHDKNYSGAETLALAMEKRYPNNIQVESILGEIEFSSNQYDQASSTFNRVLMIDPSNQTALYYKQIIPNAQNVVVPSTPVISNVPASAIESALGVNFDHAILKLDSAKSSPAASTTTGTAGSLASVYESTEPVAAIATYLQKILPPPFIYAINGPTIEFVRTASVTDPVSYVVRIDAKGGMTRVWITYSKRKQ